MFINTINNKENLKVSIPLTKGTEKTRIKRRTILNEYGIPVSTKKEPFTQKCYVEWQIGYDVIKSDTEKLENTTMPNFSFIGANGKEKTLYELSEYIKYFYEWGIITNQTLFNLKNYLLSLNNTDFLENNSELSIKRTHPIDKEINGFNFMFTQVEYPLLVYRFGDYEIVAEIKITEKQYAIGTQPMLYLCFPITELENSAKLIGRTAKTKEFANFVIDRKNIFVFVEMLKLFGTLSSNHNKDIISIIDVIINS